MQPSPRPVTVLLVDDDHDTRVICGALLRARGHGVVEAAGGEECLHLARTAEVELVALDLRMPGVDGFAAATRLRADPVTRHLPLLALTALADAGSRARALESGVDEVLVKPVTSTEFLVGVETLAARSRTARERASTLCDRGAALRDRAAVQRTASERLLDRGHAVVERIVGIPAGGGERRSSLLLGETVTACSFCGRLRGADGEWHPVPAELRAVLYAVAGVSRGLCSTCRAREPRNRPEPA